MSCKDHDTQIGTCLPCMQDAVEKLRSRLAEAEALLRELRHERRAEPYSMDGTSQWVLLRQNDFARIDFLIADSASHRENERE